MNKCFNSHQWFIETINTSKLRRFKQRRLTQLKVKSMDSFHGHFKWNVWWTKYKVSTYINLIVFGLFCHVFLKMRFCGSLKVVELWNNNIICHIPLTPGLLKLTNIIILGNFLLAERYGDQNISIWLHRFHDLQIRFVGKLFSITMWITNRMHLHEILNFNTW